jgi:hypothetical protein
MSHNRLGKCAACKKSLDGEYVESALYGSRHRICLVCCNEEDRLIETEGGNSPQYSELVKERMVEYGPPNDYD